MLAEPLTAFFEWLENDTETASAASDRTLELATPVARAGREHEPAPHQVTRTALWFWLLE
ncbi:MAG: hypothetical protein FWD12_09865 [Alphaproteobacteria bacterium]|nr:hypothetical protein [Alphaproteobacteria bacterium]